MNINFKSRKTWIIIAAAVIVTVAVILIIRRNRKEKEPEAVTPGTAAGASAQQAEASWPLRMSMTGYSADNGSYGWQVRLLQQAMNDINGSGLAVDGKFGPKTLAVLKSAFPAQLGDGEVSQAEFEAMLVVIREAYGQIGRLYLDNNALKLQFKG
ncbi:MAG: hypothetical protein MJZ90_06145 [Bacteroidales bacterium]|nr:hypothetical protein [Bacteroidales bacterium]